MCTFYELRRRFTPHDVCWLHFETCTGFFCGLRWPPSLHGGEPWASGAAHRRARACGTMKHGQKVWVDHGVWWQVEKQGMYGKCATSKSEPRRRESVQCSIDHTLSWTCSRCEALGKWASRSHCSGCAACTRKAIRAATDAARKKPEEGQGRRCSARRAGGVPGPRQAICGENEPLAKSAVAQPAGRGHRQQSAGRRASG